MATIVGGRRVCLAFGTMLTTLSGKDSHSRTHVLPNKYVNSAGSATLVSLTLNIKDLTRGQDQPCTENSEVEFFITVATEGLIFRE